MKTTIEIPDDLYREAKATAALSGRKLKDLIEEGLRLVVRRDQKGPSEAELAALWRSVIGSVESGIPDLSTNPDHLEGYGHDAPGNR